MRHSSNRPGFLGKPCEGESPWRWGAAGPPSGDRSPGKGLGIVPGMGRAASARPGGRNGFLLFPCSLTLEVSVGKATTITAVNGTDVLLPCTFSTCMGFENLHFWWTFNNSEEFKNLIDGIVKNEKSEPKIRSNIDPSRIEMVGSVKEKKNNISILILNLEFSDKGKYTCRVKNPKEKNAEHEATISLIVVDKLVKVDNTVTIIILSVVGGLIGLLIVIMLIKKFVTFIIKKTQEKKKECLVNSSGNDNTENGMAGSKAEQKGTPKL
ncbi:sodium channel regulatory subunit beta-4 isoform X1 [Notamacropus eugenii]|uniref:sodium channel regulatory subunit beta-4 isoform X1 n=2 Tax=Notamacropus eugenii TaxID=9315 RepID=UPI003B67053E